jgi:hypothetical protein
MNNDKCNGMNEIVLLFILYGVSFQLQTSKEKKK